MTILRLYSELRNLLFTINLNEIIMHVFNTKRFSVLMHLLTVLITSFINVSIMAAENPMPQLTLQQFVIHSKETIKPVNTDIIIFLKGIGSEHHSDGTIVDNAHIVATQHEKNIDIYLEIIDGVPAITEVFGYTLKFENCSAYHGVCKLTIYT